MNDLEIERCVRRMGGLARARFLGVFCADRVPKIIPDGHFLVLNTLRYRQASKGLIGHWCLVLRGMSIHDQSPSQPIVFFDPLGAMPQDILMISELLRQSPCIYYNIKYCMVITYVNTDRVLV